MPFDALPRDTDTDSDLVMLIQARECLRQGWCQGQSKRGDTYCMMGAVARVTGATNLSKGQPFRLLSLLGREINPQYCGTGIGTLLAAYNDNKIRRKEDVLGIFDKAIARIASGER